MAKEGKKAPRETPGQSVTVPAGPPTQTPEGLTEGYRDEGSQVISDALPRQNLYALGQEKLRAYFVKDWKTDGDKILGTFHFHGNRNFEKWIGLKNLIPGEYTTVKVQAPDGKIWEGKRGTNGSFYDTNGKYIAIWEGYQFEASKKSPAAAPSETAAAEAVRENKLLSQVALGETVFVGDSLTVGMQTALNGASFVAKGGRQTGWMLGQFRNFLRERQSGKYSGVKRVVIFGGVNDIASGKTPAQIQNNLSAMYREAKAAGLDVVACTIPKWDTDAFVARHGKRTLDAAILRERTEIVNIWIHNQIGLSEGPSKIAYLDREMDTGRYKRARDGLHLTGKASRAMAKFIAKEGNINLPDAA